MPALDLERHPLLDLAKELHAHQKRSGNVPYWHHVLSVSQIVQRAFAESGELAEDDSLLHDILLAAIGHDLYEDTLASRADIAEEFGKEVDGLIWHLTNEDGDDHREPYLEKMRNAPEEAKLIKLADLTENSISVAYAVHDLGLKWVHEFYLPIVREMEQNVRVEAFTKYPKTGAILRSYFDFSFSRLLENARKFE